MNFLTRSLLCAVVAGVALCVGGCVIDVPLTQEPDEGVYSAANLRLGFTPMYYQAALGDRIKTTPVHPDDAPFISGQTAVQPGNCWIEQDPNWMPSAGIFGSIGTQAWRFVYGLTGRINLLNKKDDYRTGLYNTKKQMDNTLPWKPGVYTHLQPSALSIIPSIGVQNRFDNWTLEAELGAPYQQWTASSGHDRGGTWQEVQRDRWTGFGLRYTATVGYQVDESTQLFGSIAYEDFRPKFAGQNAQITGIGGFFGLLYRW